MAEDASCREPPESSREYSDVDVDMADPWRASAEYRLLAGALPDPLRGKGKSVAGVGTGVAMGAGVGSEAGSVRRQRRPKARDMDAHALRRIKRYRLGRFLAAVLGLAGAVGVIAGGVALGANAAVLLTKSPGPMVAGLATSPVLAGGLIAAACVLILISQMATATFDAAMAVQSHADED